MTWFKFGYVNTWKIKSYILLNDLRNPDLFPNRGHENYNPKSIHVIGGGLCLAC